VLSHEVVSDVDVLGACVMCVVRCNCDGRLVVAEEDRRSCLREAELA
jgi:hypothetical protein